MESVLAFTVIFIFLGIGDIISYKTKAIVSMIFFASAAFLISFWAGLPNTIFKDSTLLPAAGVLVAILITHMGTIISLQELIRQWKTVVIALGAVAGIAIFLYIVGIPVLGREYAVSAAPPIAGGVVASIIVSGAAKAKGLELIALYASLLLVIQGFFGYPIASVCLKKEANRLTALFREKKQAGELSAASGETGAAVKTTVKPKLIPDLPKQYQTPTIILAKLGIVAVISTQLSNLTNGAVNKLVICLIAGIIFKEIGFLEEDSLTKANSFGLVVNGTLLVIFANLTSASPQAILSLLWPLICSLVLGVIGIILVTVPVGKLLGYSWQMSLAIGSTALFGFPGTYILSNEVATAVAENEEEKKAILDGILPKMLVAGFTTVTIASVILAGIMAKLL